MSDKDGGAAYPGTRWHDVWRSGEEVEHILEPYDGMTLRDWFAGQALVHQAKPSLHEYELVALFGKNRTGITREEILAADAYRIADAMLAERSK